MKRFVSIWLPHLTTDWFANKQPQLRGSAFVLKTKSHGREIITAASPEALKKGIHPGMVWADARALYQGLEAKDDLPNLSQQLTQRIAEWCIRFTPAAAPDAPDGIILDASGCTHLWGGDAAYIADIEKRLAARGYAARAAIADTIGTAWATARFGKGVRVVESGNQMQCLLNLPPASLRLEEAIIARLHKLGLTTIKSIVAIPRASLRRRFGKHLSQRISQALGEEEEFIQPVYPAEPFQERLPCMEPIVNRTGIDIALQRTVEALCKQLRTKGKGLRAAYFRCYRTDSSAQGIEIGTSRPSHHEEHLLHLFSLKLDTLRPDAGIELFVLEATKVEDHEPTQESFWNNESRMNEEKLAELMDRLAGKVGWDAITRYLPSEHWWPERSVTKAAQLDEKPATEWRLEKRRPVRLLQPPERIEVTAPIPDYPPMSFRYKGVLHKVVKADGPERIEQEWWIQDGEHRDYYAVEDEDGRRYWLFRLGHYTGDKRHQWFLHGFFC